MIGLTIEQIAAATGAEILAGDALAVADDVSIDSRRIEPGACFFAIVGERHDGHDYVQAAIDAGAAAIVAHRSRADDLKSAGSSPGTAVLRVADTTAALQDLAGWLRRRLDPTVVAITGSLGKTSTKELTAALLGSRFEVWATPGNLNNHWGLPLSLLGLETRHEVMVAELAMSRAGEIAALTRIAHPDVGVITNVAPAHMEGFADLEAVAAAKGELADELPETATLVVNQDDPLTREIGRRAAAGRRTVVTFGRDAAADVRATDVVREANGWRFTLTRGASNSGCRIDLPIPGAGAVPNFLAAATVAGALGVADRSIAAVAATLEPLANRGAVRELGDLTLLDESYNASPVATEGALETLSHLAGERASGRRVAALGDMLEMGDWTEPSHRQIGARAAELDVDLLVAVGRHASLIEEGARDAGMAAEAVRVFADAAEAGGWLAAQLRPGDIVLVKGSRATHMELVVEAITATHAGSRALAED